METKIMSVNVSTCNELGEVVEPLSIVNCAPAQLNSILSLCKKNYEVRITFVEVELPNGMRSKVND